MLKGIQIDLIVPDKYKTLGSLTSSTFRVPMFNYDYSIDYSFSDIAYQAESVSGQRFPNYSIAGNLVMVAKYSFEWSGLLAPEKELFVDFIKSFNNSFQPFTMRIFTDATTYIDYTMIIESDNLTLSKDMYDLWSISLTLIKL